jgi:hypothetical protein
MAAGQGFKTFATGDVLTAADTNGYLMQGVWVFADAAARTAAVTSPQEGNMSFLKDTNSTEYYSGSAWVAVGSGGMTQIGSPTTLTGASVTINSIPQTYKNLFMIVRLPLVATDAWQLKISFNGDTGANRHATAVTTNLSNQAFNQTGADLTSENGMDNAVTQGLLMCTFPDYTNTTTWKIANTVSFGNHPTTATNYVYANYGLAYNQTSAISSLQIRSGSGNLTSGTVVLYGVN